MSENNNINNYINNRNDEVLQKQQLQEEFIPSSSSSSSRSNNDIEMNPVLLNMNNNNEFHIQTNNEKPINIEIDGMKNVKEIRNWKQAIISQIIPTIGDVNACISIVMDNLANFALYVGILVYGFDLPRDLVTKYFIPGPAFAIMIGSLLLSAYAIYLDYHETNPNVHYTAIPLGLDTPTTIGLPLLVCGPVYVAGLKSGLSPEDAALESWLVGCATVFLIGCFKALLTMISFTTRQFHPAGKAGALAGIGLSLLGLNEILTIFEEPVVGWVSLWILLLVLMHRQNKQGKILGVSLPFNLSGVLVSVVIGSALYYIMTSSKISVTPLPEGVTDHYYVSYPHPSNIFKSFVNAIRQNISIVIPYAILVNIGSITVTDGANNVGNKYKVKYVLLIDAFSTIIGSFFGSTTQTTPYIGHTVFHKKFRARSGFSIISGLLIGAGGFFGYLGLLTNILPKPAILPIFIFIAFEICSETFHNTKGIKPHHSSAVLWAFFPALFQFANIVIGQISPILNRAVIDSISVEKKLSLSPLFVQKIGTIMILAHGFICTSLFWGTALAYILDNRLVKASVFLFCCSFLTFFGIIHSVDPNGEVYIPWNTNSTIPYQWSVSYFLIALITLGFSFIKTHEIEQHTPHDIDEIDEEEDKQKLDFKGKVNLWKSNTINDFTSSIELIKRFFKRN